MRYLTTLGTVALTVALWSLGAAAQNDPPGSYQQSCRNIGVNGPILPATCQNTSGGWQSTQLRDYQRCSSEIANNNGSLRCDMRTNDYSNGNYSDGNQGNWQNGTPSGGYAQTCQNIRMTGNTLEARCQTRSNSWTQTSLQNINQCTGGIENDDGRRVCNKGTYNGQYGNGNQQGDRHDNGQYGNGGQQGDGRDNGEEYGQNNRYRLGQNGAPYGGYTQTCQNIRTSGSTLQASCQKKNGQWKQASLRNYNQCSSQIQNNNGKLVCSR